MPEELINYVIVHGVILTVLWTNNLLGLVIRHPVAGQCLVSVFSVCLQPPSDVQFLVSH